MERKPLASTENATVDVDALWASMNGGSTIDPSTKDEAAPKVPVILNTGHRSNGAVPKQPLDESTNAQATVDHAGIALANRVSVNADDMVAIQRRYEFAGETITEEKLVPKSSAEARLYFQSEQSPRPTPPKPPLRRPKKRTSMFEPNLNGTFKGLSPTRGRSIQLNTIDKSKLDWAGYVDKEGIADELDEHSRAKEGYLGRMDFLGRVEAKREEDLKGARNK
ncbi:MAG: swr complex subunit [Candelina submexicana]|nr:MAG: swr complex subunit [Candelina submexicana]